MTRSDLLSDDDIDAIQSRIDSATAGPWKSYIEGRDHMSGSDFIRTGAGDIYLTGGTRADQDFIACARQDLPVLIDELHRLRDLLIDKIV